MKASVFKVANNGKRFAVWPAHSGFEVFTRHGRRVLCTAPLRDVADMIAAALEESAIRETAGNVTLPADTPAELTGLC